MRILSLNNKGLHKQPQNMRAWDVSTTSLNENSRGETGIALVVTGNKGRERIIDETGLVVSNWPNLHGYLV
jgi:hypothetical protein